MDELVEYSIKCPRCFGKASALMEALGLKGTYREVLTRLGATKLICKACGMGKEISIENAYNYELWYVTSFKGHRLWANNKQHVLFLISWLEGKADLTIADKAMIAAFPKWLVLGKNKKEILHCLYQLIEQDEN